MFIQEQKKEAQVYFEEQFPQLKYIKNHMKFWIWDIEHKNHPLSAWRQMADLENTYGRTIVTIPIPKDDHDIIDPVQELTNMGFDGKVLRIKSNPNDEISPYGNLPNYN